MFHSKFKIWIPDQVFDPDIDGNELYTLVQGVKESKSFYSYSRLPKTFDNRCHCSLDQ